MTVQLGPRHRQRIAIADPNQVVGKQTITVDGHYAGGSTSKVNYYGHPAYDFTIMEKCWDELHHREEVVKYFIKRPGRRRVYLSPDEAATAKTIPELGGSLYAKVGRGRYFTSGGPFTLIRCNRLDEFIVKGKGVYRESSGPYSAIYEGGFLPYGWSLWGPSSVDLYYGFASGMWSPAQLQAGMEQLGAKAWNRARPKTSSSDILTFLGELREAPRMLKTTAKGFHDLYRNLGGHKTSETMSKRVADQFLNQAFGWAPFVRDLMDFHQTYVNLDRNIRQMIADNGKWVKRGVRVDESNEMKDRSVYNGQPLVYPTPHEWNLRLRNNRWGETITFRESYTRSWFVGSFKYYVPRPPDTDKYAKYNRVMDTLRQYGVRISPSVIWNLTPWSWLGDWFGNVGDIIDNVDAQNNDNLTARYAYIMRHTRERYVNDSTLYLRGAADVRVTWAREIESKTRIEANPFQFGQTGGGLNSAYRVAILAALGLAKRG